jgi:flagellar hook-associated protein 2
MVGEISLGTFSVQNGKNVLTGGASKLDTTAIVDALATAKAAPATRLTASNKTISTQTAAIAQLNTLLQTLETSADALRNPPGVANDSQNIFQYRTASLTSSSGLNAANYATVAVQPGASVQSYTIDSITQLATATKQQSNVITAADSTTASVVTASGSATPGLFQAGTINLRAEDGTAGGVPVTFNQGDSLSTVVSDINAVSTRTGIQASILTVATGQYQIIFTATQTGTNYGFDMSAAAGSTGAGVTSDPSGVFAQMTFGGGTGNVVAQNAIFSVDGVSLTRQSNSISDVLSNVTINLLQTTPSALQVNVTPDTTIITNAITSFADAYNAFRLFASTQQQLNGDGTPKDTAVLYNDTTFRNIVSDVSSEVSRVVTGIASGQPQQLADVAITLDNFAGDDSNPATTNIMTVDTDKLSALLQSNFAGVQQAFEFTETASDSNFVNSARANNLTVSNYAVNIDTVAGTYTATYTDATGTQTVPLTGTALSGGGISLTGQAGTIFAGSSWVYASNNTTATINVTATQGIGDRFYNLMDSITNTTDGTLTTDTGNLTAQQARNQTQIDTINDQVAAYRDQLTTTYANLEAAISSANSILDLLDAQQAAEQTS